MQQMLFPEAMVFKTGERVKMSGDYVDQTGSISHHHIHKTFPPTNGKNRKRECAYRTLLQPTNTELN